jgi:hypothetical protein
MHYVDQSGRRYLKDTIFGMVKKLYRLVQFHLEGCVVKEDGIWIVSIASSHKGSETYAVDIYLSWEQAATLRRQLNSAFESRMKGR